MPTCRPTDGHLVERQTWGASFSRAVCHVDLTFCSHFFQIVIWSYETILVCLLRDFHGITPKYKFFLYIILQVASLSKSEMAEPKCLVRIMRLTVKMMKLLIGSAVLYGTCSGNLNKEANETRHWVSHTDSEALSKFKTIRFVLMQSLPHQHEKLWHHV